MGVVVLTPEEARRRAQPIQRTEVAWCSCDIGSVCTCGNEAPVVPTASPAGWRVSR